MLVHLNMNKIMENNEVKEGCNCAPDCKCERKEVMKCVYRAAKLAMKAASVVAAFMMVSELGKTRHHIKKIEKALRHDK